MEITESVGAIQNLTETKIDGAQMMKDNVKIAPISNEQKKVIEKLEEVLLFLKSTPIKNDEALTFVKKPLNQLQSNLKYLPTEQSFTNFPAEIKRKMLDYLCDSHAFTAASVCQEWKEILTLTSVSKLTISSEEDCACQYENGDDSDSGECECGLNPMTLGQLQDLFGAIEKNDGIVEKVKLEALNLTNLDQDRLANCFMKKIKNLTLNGVTFKEDIFFRKLSEEPTEFQLTSLTLNSDVDFRSLINPEDMERLFNRMVKLRLKGTFTWAQVVTVEVLPDVEVLRFGEKAVIQKGF